MRIGVGVGKSCSGCDEIIDVKEAPIASEYDYGMGNVYRFHESCWKIWDEERHRPVRRA